MDRVADMTTRDGARVEYALPIWSDRLGLIGKCDVVEFWPDGVVYPVEYKHGSRRAWLNDDIQLAAQAICLEEMLGVRIECAAIFHAGSKRRREVAITGALRGEVEVAVSSIREMIARGRLPDPTTDTRRCGECSLKDICQPEAARAPHGESARLRALFDPDAP